MRVALRLKGWHLAANCVFSEAEEDEGPQVIVEPRDGQETELSSGRCLLERPDGCSQSAVRQGKEALDQADHLSDHRSSGKKLIDALLLMSIR